MGILRKKEDAFFVMFRDFSATLVDMADNFGTIINNYSNIERAVADLKISESECDSKSHAILQRINESFVTPFDREDIFAMVNQLDDLADYMEDIASKFVIYDVSSLRDDAVEIGNVIVDAIKQVEVLFITLPKADKTADTKNGNISEAKNAIIEINRLENLGDAIYRRALTKLFRDAIPPVEIIKWKDLYEGLEETLDACEHLADTVEGVIMKNA